MCAFDEIEPFDSDEDEDDCWEEDDEETDQQLEQLLQSLPVPRTWTALLCVQGLGRTRLRSDRAGHVPVRGGRAHCVWGRRSSRAVALRAASFRTRRKPRWPAK
eukprot:1835460-Prymnesium_polylepis.1